MNNIKKILLIGIIFFICGCSFFDNDKKVMRFSAQAMDEETTQVFADVHGKRIQVYNWKPQDKEVNLFYDLFENKLREYRAFILCPSCKAKISSLVKFCPECGVPVK